MKQLHIFKRLTTLALCAGLVTTGALAANSVTRMIQANYSGIHITVDGKQITLYYPIKILYFRDRFDIIN